MFLSEVKTRAISKLGGPNVNIELDDNQMNELYESAYINWNLYSKLSKNADMHVLEHIKELWIESYFQALCKEALGRIYSRFSSMPIPGGIKLEYKSLLRESVEEKYHLVCLLIPPPHQIILVVYINTENIDDLNVKDYISQIQEKLPLDNKFKFFIIPVKNQESKIECVYPNFIYDDDMKVKLNICLDKIINDANKQ